MPEFTVYFSFVLGFIALIFSLVVGITLITSSYYAIRWGRHWCEVHAGGQFGQPRGSQKAVIIVLPVRRDEPTTLLMYQK